MCAVCVGRIVLQRALGAWDVLNAGVDAYGLAHMRVRISCDDPEAIVDAILAGPYFQ